MASVLVRRSQLQANDFPPVCAMTGAPAETWRKFRFFTPSPWVHLILLSLGTEFCLLGVVAYLLAWFVAAPQASGCLPLTRSCAARLDLMLWASVALLPLSVLVTATGLVVGNTLEPLRSRVGVWLDIAGVALAVLFVIGLYVRPLFGPGASVHKTKPGETDTLVELKRVHSSFVSAVHERSTP